MFANRWNFWRRRGNLRTLHFKPEMAIRPFYACTMHLAIIITTVQSLWTWLLGRYHVPQTGAQPRFLSQGDEQPEAVRERWCVGEGVPLPLSLIHI